MKKKCEHCSELFESNRNKRFCSRNCKNYACKRRRVDTHKNGPYYVYYIPEHHYIGITNNVNERMTKHRSEGKVTDGYETLCSFERKVDAAWLEIMFQQRGYLGFRGYRA